MPRTLALDSLEPELALLRLRDGNRRFVAGQETALRGWRPGLAEGQRPFAAILGCSDSRAPAEYVFDQGLGDLFVIRVAGNIVAPSLVGSVEFAVSQFGTRLVVVMGHSQCGGIAAALHAVDHAGVPESKNLQAIVDRIVPNLTDLPPASDPERTRVATRKNAQASARGLVTSSPLLAELAGEGRVKVVASVYDLKTGVVEFLD
jgi:carbonic anhydrase